MIELWDSVLGHIKITCENTKQASSQGANESSSAVQAGSKFTHQGTCGENLTWTLDEAGTLTIRGKGEMDNSGHQAWPWKDQLKGTSKNIRAVVIENGITSIGNSAFNFSLTSGSPTSVTIADSVTRIEDHAFEKCDCLTSISISKSVTFIGSLAFYGCSSLKDVYYRGSRGKRGSIRIGTDNGALMDAAWHYQ